MTEIHSLFDWATHTKRGMLLFIDEAVRARGAACKQALHSRPSHAGAPAPPQDAFLSKRGGGVASDEVRAALNALLFRTGSPSRDVALVLATNRPGARSGARFASLGAQGT